jgi:hypothetical protein
MALKEESVLEKKLFARSSTSFVAKLLFINTMSGCEFQLLPRKSQHALDHTAMLDFLALVAASMGFLFSGITYRIV